MTDIWATRKTLIQRVRDKHDHESWEEFVDVYKQFLYVVVRNLNLNHHDTEEIVQEVFLKTWNHLENLIINQVKENFVIGYPVLPKTRLSILLANVKLKRTV